MCPNHPILKDRVFHYKQTIHFGGLKSPYFWVNTLNISKNHPLSTTHQLFFNFSRPPLGRSLLWLQIAHIGPQSVGALNSTMHAGCSCLHGNLQVWGGENGWLSTLDFCTEKKIAKNKNSKFGFWQRTGVNIYFWIFLVVCFGFVVWFGLVRSVCLFGCLVVWLIDWLIDWLIVCLFLLGFVFGASASSSFTLLDGNHFFTIYLELYTPQSLAVSCRGPKGKKVVFQTSSFKFFPVKCSGWVFPKIGGNPPKWMVYNGKPY